MNTEQHEEAEKDSPIRYVEELAGEGDYWLSLTDVARVTRTSDSMVRRWVTSGRLACKKEAVGINQRTRMVRASDVRKIREIVDPTAAITDDIRKMDLASIPKQQEQIMKQQEQVMQDHQNLAALLQTALTALSESAQKQAATQVALDTITQQFAALHGNHQVLLERQEKAEVEAARQASQIENALHTVDEQYDAFTVLVHSQAEQIQVLEGKAEKSVTQIHQVKEDLQAERQNDREEAKRLHAQLDSRLTLQVAALSRVEAALRTIQSNQDDQQHQLATLEQDQARDVADLHRQVENTSKEIALKITALAVATDTGKATIVEIQQHANSHEQQLNALRRELEEEVHARKAQALAEEKALKKGRKPAQGV